MGADFDPEGAGVGLGREAKERGGKMGEEAAAAGDAGASLPDHRARTAVKPLNRLRQRGETGAEQRGVERCHEISRLRRAGSGSAHMSVRPMTRYRLRAMRA